jgi:neutral ceramidase
MHQKTNFKICATRATINPSMDVYLAGWTDRSTPTNEISSDLEINTLYLKCQELSVCIISIDSLYVNEDLFDKNQGETTFIFAGASHTHFAPALDKTKQKLGKINEEYFQKIKLILKKNIIQSETHSIDLSVIEYYKTRIPININRRRNIISYTFNPFHWTSKIEIAPSFLKKTNDEVHIVIFKNSEAKVICILWSFACHPTNWCNSNEISSDYIGDVRNSLRTTYGMIPVLFFQGFSGDLKAIQKPFRWTYKNVWKELFHLPIKFSKFTEVEYIDWTTKLKNHIKNILLKNKPETYNPRLSWKEIKIPLNQILNANIEGLTDLKITELHLAENLVIIGFSAEPVFEYIKHIKTIYKNKTIIPVGCIGNVYGYLPTNKMIKEGGYESKDFFKIFGYKNTFKEDVEGVIYTNIKNLKNAF